MTTSQSVERKNDGVTVSHRRSNKAATWHARQSAPSKRKIAPT